MTAQPACRRATLLALAGCAGLTTLYAQWAHVDLEDLGAWLKISRSSNRTWPANFESSRSSRRPFYVGANGTRCPAQLAIRSRQTCEAAVRTLGLCVSELGTWTGYTPDIQSFCSYRQACSEQRRSIHFNAHGAGNPRSDLSPVCRQMVGSPADSNFALIEPKIPALVVTYDGHRVFLQNMLASYVEYWPLHPFQFYVPYNGEFPSDVLQYGDFVTLVKTPLGINETVLSLLKSCACSDRIVYFAMDDYYISSVFSYAKLEIAVSFLRAQLENPKFLTFALVYTEGKAANGTPALPSLEPFLFPNGSQSEQMQLGRLKKRPPTNVMVWSHSFWRASFIHDLYVQGANITDWYHNNTKGRIANRWDDLLTTGTFQNLIEKGLWDIFRVAEPVLEFQESTHVGKIDPSALADLDRRGITVPSKYLPPSIIGSGRWGGKW